MAKKTSSKLTTGASRKAWKMLQNKQPLKEISNEVGYTVTAIKLFANRRFKKEADRLWSGRDGPRQCAVCQTDTGINAHHILEKSVYPHLRYDPMNRIDLCQNHHLFSVVVSPHKCTASCDRFLELLADEWPDLYHHYLEHRDDKKSREIDYEAEYWRLKNGCI